MQARGQSEFDWRVANVINEISVSTVLWEWINPALICTRYPQPQKRKSKRERQLT